MYLVRSINIVQQYSRDRNGLHIVQYFFVLMCDVCIYAVVIRTVMMCGRKIDNYTPPTATALIAPTT